MTTVDLVLEEEAWLDALPELEAVADIAAHAALEAAGLEPERYELCLLACDDARIAALNADFRGRETPTNVLSWPATDLPLPGPEGPQVPLGNPEGPPIALGDVAIALQTVANEARAAALPLKDHTIHLILHGVLHLLGYDHTDDASATVMEGLEIAALGRLGIGNPYDRPGWSGAAQE